MTIKGQRYKMACNMVDRAFLGMFTNNPAIPLLLVYNQNSPVGIPHIVAQNSTLNSPYLRDAWIRIHSFYNLQIVNVYVNSVTIGYNLYLQYNRNEITGFFLRL